jgi:hypothetical protein
MAGDPEAIGDGAEWPAAIQLLGLAPEHPDPHAGPTCQHLVEQPGLAHPGFTFDDHRLAMALPGKVEKPLETARLVSATDQ